jgi:S-DNA-T family DNA segregation ATPase FtsK/SpoIIIE
MPHLLIAGATGFGKSVHINAIICQLMWRNPPDMVKFLMVDLKGGMELVDYAGSPYLWRPIVTEIEDVVDSFRDYKKEMFKRQEIFAGKARTLSQYNRLHRETMPYLILVVDELAQVLKHPNSDMSNRAMLELGSILNISRATGGHCILCTQRPSTDVISGYIKTNISSRVAFRTPTKHDSRVILDTSHAESLEIPGRAWMLDGAQRLQVQTPWISPHMIRRVVKAIGEREHKEDKEIVTMIDVARASIDKFDGSLSRRVLYEEFRGRLSEYEIRDMLSSYDNQVVMVDEKEYRVVPSNGSNQPRRLEPVE